MMASALCSCCRKPTCDANIIKAQQHFRGTHRQACSITMLCVGLFLFVLLHQKEELGESFHAVDYDQMKIENRQFQEKIEERNHELLQLKVTAGNTLQVLNRKKVRLSFGHTAVPLDQDIFRVKRSILCRDVTQQLTSGHV